MPLAKIRKLLPSLSKTELSQLKMEVDFLANNSGKFLTPDQQLLYRNIIGGMRRRHVRYMPFNEEENHKPRLQGYDHTSFLRAFDAIETYIVSNLPKKIAFPGAVRHQFYSILVKSTIGGLVDEGKSAGIINIVEALKDPDGIMDYAFPGYARAGVLWSILG